MSIEIQACMSIDIQYVHRHTRSTLKQVTSIALVWRFLQAKVNQSVIVERNVRKNANILIFVQKLSIIELHKTEHLKFGYCLLLYVVKKDHACRSTYNIYSISIDIRHTVSRLTYSISIDIHGVYVNRDTVGQSRYCMSIGCCA